MSTILSANVVMTRKPHVCWGCRIKYPPGTKMNAVTTTDGGVGTVYWCPTCQEYWDRHMEYGDLVLFGEIRRNDPEEWEKIRAELGADVP